MSNVVEETDEESGTGSGKNGRFIGADLANLVQYDPSLEQAATGARLSEADAIERLGKRLPVTGDIRSSRGTYEIDQQRRDAAAVIVTSLPEVLWTEGVLDAIDVRPYLEALDGKKVRHWVDRRWMIDNEGEEVLQTSSWLEAENVRLRDELSKGLPGISIEQREARLDELMAYDSGRGGFMPTGAEGAATGAVDANGELLDPLGTTGTVNNPQLFFREDEMRIALQSGRTDLMGLVDMEQNEQAELGGGQFNVPVEHNSFHWDGEDRGAGGPTSGGRGKTLSAGAALNYLSTLSEQEVRNMQLKLANAGYYDRVENGAYFVEGYAYDQATRQAWQLLLTDSIQQNKPVTQVLGRNMRDYRDKTAQARMKALTDIDPNANRLYADDWAQNVIGRNLTTEEHDELLEHLQMLREQRASYVTGAQNNVSRTGLQSETGVTEDDVGEYVQSKFDWEGKLARQSEFLYGLNKKMGG